MSDLDEGRDLHAAFGTLLAWHAQQLPHGAQHPLHVGMALGFQRNDFEPQGL